VRGKDGPRCTGAGTGAWEPPHWTLASSHFLTPFGPSCLPSGCPPISGA
jgi:hypothetical protein